MAYTNEQLIKAAELYYYEDYTHMEIAKETHLSRSAITRMMQVAKKRNIVKIIIDKSPINIKELENKLATEKRLDKAIIVNKNYSSPYDNIKSICNEASKYLMEIIKDKDIVGLGWGNSVYEMINTLAYTSNKNATIVPIIGGIDENDEIYNLNSIVQQAGEKLGCNHYKLYAPAIVDSKSVCEAIKSDSKISNICDVWDKMDIAVIGIGALKTKMAGKIKEFLSQHTVNFSELGIVADVCCNYMDINGNTVTTILNDSLIAANINQLKKTPKTIAIACGQDKKNAILSCLNNGFINVLVTDTQTALDLLEE